MNKNKQYMHIHTGSVDSKDGWEDFEKCLADGSLIEVMVENINENFGDPVQFDSVKELEEAIFSMGYKLPEDGLKEKRDYIFVQINSH